VATRYGIPADIVERANAIIPTFSRAREHLLEELASERTLAERLRREVQSDATEQRRLRLELEQERSEVRTTFQRHLEQEYRELLGRVRMARTELETVRSRLRHADYDKKELSQLERSIDGAAHLVAIGSDIAEAVRTAKAPVASAPAMGELTVGGRVHVARLGMDVELLELPRKGSVRVRAGSVTLSVAISDLSRASSHGNRAAKAASKKVDRAASPRESPPQAPGRTTPMRMSHNTLDLRGERVDDALDRVDQFIDELLRRAEPAGFILHGHGTGALKQAVRQHVRSLHHVAESGPANPEDGGDAFTIVWLGS
jgi:DNA mismatch repair protein MutS2